MPSVTVPQGVMYLTHFYVLNKYKREGSLKPACTVSLIVVEFCFSSLSRHMQSDFLPKGHIYGILLFSHNSVVYNQILNSNK